MLRVIAVGSPSGETRRCAVCGTDSVVVSGTWCSWRCRNVDDVHDEGWGGTEAKRGGDDG